MSKDFLGSYTRYKALIDNYLQSFLQDKEPAALYRPIRYAMLAGGKRIRPVLTMAACGAVGGDPLRALHGAIAVEILHNFTLVHDDIMDAADTRRGRPTVHKRWNSNAAILAGDGMLALAHRVLLQTEGLQRVQEIVGSFSTGIIEVCEGQAYDLEFAERDSVSLEEYLLMIEKKTARMLVMAVKVGALIGDATSAQLEALEHYALAIGKAFQIQDDLLDIMAEQAKFGKTVGGDVIEGKRTFLIVRALERVVDPDDRKLLAKFQRQNGLAADEVPAMRALFERNAILTEAERSVEKLSAEANRALDCLPASEHEAMLHWFSDMLLQRDH